MRERERERERERDAERASNFLKACAHSHPIARARACKLAWSRTRSLHFTRPKGDCDSVENLESEGKEGRKDWTDVATWRLAGWLLARSTVGSFSFKRRCAAEFKASGAGGRGRFAFHFRAYNTKRAMPMALWISVENFLASK